MARDLADRLAAQLAAAGAPSPSSPPAPSLATIARLLEGLPTGQRRVAAALIAEPRGRTYPQAAASLGIHIGTLHRHLGRIRQRHPEVYRALMAQREEQLAGRHRRALRGVVERRASRRYLHRHLDGCEPWER